MPNSFKYGFSTRFGGISKAPFNELNLGFHTGDDKNAVKQNRELLKNEIGANSLVFMEQIHGNKICEITSENLDEILEFPPKCDAIFTKLSGVGLCVMVADCAPILAFDSKNGVIAAIHAGRAGVCERILTKTIKAMKSAPNDLKIIVGPHIQGSCYEVGELDLGEFNKYKFKGFFDISKALKDEINALNVKDYEISEVCTHCDNKYFSYRRDKITGRFAGWIMKG